MRQDLQTLNMELPVSEAPFCWSELISTGGGCHQDHITEVCGPGFHTAGEMNKMLLIDGRMIL